MLGKNGVFNIEKGTFRVQPSEDYLYRDVRVKTFIYEYTESTPYKVKKQNVISELALHMKNGLQKISGKVTIEQQENIKKISELAVSEVESILANQNSSVFVTQQTAPQKIIAVSRKQVIPVLDKVAAAVSSLVNQAVTRIPLAESDITRKIIPPVVIPPPLLHVPVPTGSPILQPPMINGKIVALQKNVKPSTQEAFVKILPGPGKVNTSQKVQLTIAPGVESNIQTINEYTKKAEEVLVEFASGEAYNAKQWKASEKLTSAITYSTAIEGYDIGTYDYTTGDGVSYTINLAVRDIQIDFSINSSARNQPWDVYSRMK
jgi:hypothetical protein